MHTESRLKHWTIDDEIPVRMPLLDRWLDMQTSYLPLKGVTALLIQHQLGGQVPQARALIELGIAPEDLFWIDIPYTSSKKVQKALIRLGIPEKNLLIHRFMLMDDYGKYQRLRVQQFLRDLSSDLPPMLLVLDDGSYMLEALSCLRQHPRRVAIVEQTTRGIIKIEHNASLAMCADEFPLINVARSQPKTILEPPFIGIAVCDALKNRLGADFRTVPGDRSLVLGYGAIGEQVAAFLNEILGFNRDHIHVFDPVTSRMERAASSGFSIWEKADRRYMFRLVVGCSGRASFTLGDHVFLKDGAFLASATSGTVELSRKDFIELADASPYDDIWIDHEGLDLTDIHSDIRFNFIDRNVTFVNGGFPVNFDGRVNCIPPHYIQPTTVMMCSAAIQAVKSKKKGLQDLDTEFCRWLTEEFRKELGEEAYLIPSE